MAALRHRELAEHRVVEAELMLVALAQKSERRGRPEIAERRRPLAVSAARAAVVLRRLRVGVKTQHRRAQSRVDRDAGARQRAGRRAAADVDRLAEVEFERELIGGRLRPERIAGAGHRRRQDQSVDLALLEAGLVEQRFENFRAHLPDVAIGLLDDLGLGIADDRGVT